MKKLRITATSILLTAALLLSGCAEQPDNPLGLSSDNSTETSSANTESEPEVSSTEELPEPGEPLVLIGLDGKAVPEEDYISALGLDYEEIPTTGLTAENFKRVKTEGAYVMMPTGCRTTIDHADVFDSENNIFTDLLPDHKTDYFRVKAGDEICGFKVKSAFSNFVSSSGAFDELFTDPKTGEKVYFDGNLLELEGEIELTGYIRVILGEMTFWGTGDIQFIPADREVNLPVIDYQFDSDEGFYHFVGEYVFSATEKLGCVNEYGAVKLDPAAVDTSGIPADGSWIKVRVTLNNISMSCSTYIIPMSAVFADITELTIL